MHDAVAIPLKLVAIRMGKLRIPSPPCARDWKLEMGEMPWHRVDQYD
jgi:hypothetical protein